MSKRFTPAGHQSKVTILHRLLAFTLLTLLIINAFPAYASQSISVAYSTDSIPFQFKDENGNPSGMIVDFWRCWEESTGIKVNFIPGTWEEALSMVKSGEVDAHAGLFHSREREKYLDFGAGLTKTDTHIFYHESLPQLVAGKELLPYRVGIIEGDYVDGYLERNVPGIIKTAYPNYASMMQELREGRLKTFAADTPTAVYNLNRYNLTNDFQFHVGKPLYRNEWFVAVPKGKSETLAMINKGMALISSDKATAITRKWSQTGIQRDPNTIIIAIDRNHPPYYSIGPDGLPVGMVVDFWKKWAETVNAKIDFRPSSWAESLEAIKTGQADIHAGLFINDERLEWMDFGKEFYQVDTALYFKKGTTPAPLKALAGKRVGAIEGTYQYSFINNDYPGIKLIPTQDSDTQIIGLLKGQWHAIPAETLVAEGVLQKMGLQGTLTRSPTPLFTNALHPAVAKGNSKLLNLIENGFAKINTDELANIEKRWVSGNIGKYYSSELTPGGVELTLQEKQWIKENRTLSIAVMDAWPPISRKNEEGNAEGIDTDILKVVGNRLGLEFDVIASPFKEGMQMVLDGKVDAIMDISRNKEREERFAFTKNYLTIPHVVVGRVNGPFYKTETDLNGKTIALERGFYNIKYFQEKFPKVLIKVKPNTAACLEAVSNGEVDAYAGNRAVVMYLIARDLLTNLEIQGKLKKKGSPLAIGVRKDDAILASILDKGLTSLTTLEKQTILSRWTGQTTARTKARLSQEERLWIKDNPVVRVGATTDWPPFEFEENDKYVGVAADIVRIVADRTGLRLDIKFNNWSDILAGLKDGSLDMGPAMVKTKERSEYLSFSTPVFVSHVAIWTETTVNNIRSIDDLRGKTVAVEKGYATHELLKTKYPEVKLILTTSAIEAITLASGRQVDAYIGNQAAASYLIDKHIITNLKVSGYFPDASRDLRMGIRKDLPLLRSILNKGLATINGKEKLQLLSNYVGELRDASTKLTIPLTEEEMKWLQTHDEIKLGIDPNWPPIEYLLNDKHSGLSAEYVNRLSRDIGLVFSKPPLLPWAQVIEQARLGHIDLLPATTKTEEREQYLTFTKPYAKYPIVVYQRTDAIPFTNMVDLEGQSVGTVKGYAIAKHLDENHSGIDLKLFHDHESLIEALLKGKVAAAVGNLVVMEHLKQKLSTFNIAPSFKTPYAQELRFGIRKDWPQLVQIIDKWLDNLDTATRNQMERTVNISTDVPFIAEPGEASVDIKQYLLLGVGLIVVFAASMIILLFLRRVIRSRAETLYSSHQYKVVGIIVGILFLCLVVVATWYALGQVENRVRSMAGEILESVLLTTHEALSIWEKQNRTQMIELVEDPVIRGSSTALLALPRNREVVENSPALWNVRNYFSKISESRGFDSFAIISSDMINLASSENASLLDKNLISIQRPRLLEKVFKGQTIFIPPILMGTDEDGESRAYVSIAAPIKGYDGKINTALILYFDASKNYQRIVEMGRIGATGETYAVDKNGRLISLSRFADDLNQNGIASENQMDMLNLRVSDPGGNILKGHKIDQSKLLPLTVSANSTTLGKSGMNLQGYRDYRGVRVFGTWLWDSELDLGLIVEIDEEEALGAYRLVRNTAISVIFITILLGSLMTGLSNWIGQSAARSLSKAKEELEDRVDERTAELTKITVAVEQSPSTVVITDLNGTIQYVNPRFTEMTGYTQQEAIGLNPRVLNSGEHSEGFYKEMWQTILRGEIWVGDFHNKKKNGDLFWERAHIAPIFTEEGELTHFVAVKEDITERREQERRFQSLLDAAPDAMVIVNQDGSIALVNSATEQLFDYTREEMVGHKVEMLLPEYIRDVHPAHRNKFFADPSDLSLVENKNFIGQSRSGNQIPVDISLSPFKASDGLQVIASVRDITERKKAEAAIAASEERTRLILSSAGEGIFGVNLRGEVIFINEAALMMLGFEREEFMGKGVHDLIHHSHSDGSFYPVEKCPMRHAFTDGISSRIDDEVLWRKDGSKFDVEYSAVPVLRGTEKIGAVISFQDISARKRAQQERDDAYQVITSSIQYASRIQRSVLPPYGRMDEFTSDHFVIWEPRDVVGGDLYWVEPWGDGAVIILGDCTGHGVPGAFMTLLTTGALESSLMVVPEGDAAKLISQMHQLMQVQLGQDNHGDGSGSDDGLELGACYIPSSRKTMTFSGARMPLFIDDGETIDIIKPDKKGIAYRGIPFDFVYTNKIIPLDERKTYYMTTDGLIDQVGGDKRRGFGKKRFKATLEELRSIPLSERGDKMYTELLTYQGKEKQRDDISVIGFKI